MLQKKLEPLKQQTLVQSLPSRHHSLLLLEATDTVGNVVFSDLPSSTFSNPELCTLSLPSAKVSAGGLFHSDLVAYLWGNARELDILQSPTAEDYAPSWAQSSRHQAKCQARQTHKK